MVEAKITQYLQLYESMKTTYKWKIGDPALRMIPLFYLMKDHPFDSQRYESFLKGIQNQTGIFSNFRGTNQYLIAAMMDTEGYTAASILQLMELEKRLKQQKIRGPYMPMVAVSLLSEPSLSPRLVKAQEIYQMMKKEHKFLTGSDDLPMAVLLAKNDRQPEQLIERMEIYYDRLSKKRYHKGNMLQMMTHILTVLQPEILQISLVERCEGFLDEMKRQKVKWSDYFYPQIPLLVLNEQPIEEVVRYLNEYTKQLSVTKGFKWQGSMNTMLAAMLVVSDFMKSEEYDALLRTGVTTVIQQIMQAQQAAMIAAIGASSAAAASASSN
jgi:hypothetical protein